MENSENTPEIIENNTDEIQSFDKKVNSNLGENAHILRRNKTIRRGSIYDDLKSYENLFRPEFVVKKKLKNKNEKLWRLMDTYLSNDSYFIQKSIVTHIEYTLARTRFDLDNYSIYQGTSLSVRDRLLERWNDCQTIMRSGEIKRVSYLSLEFLLGRALQNSLINIDAESNYSKALDELGYKLEDVYDKENDPALGNGGLGRLAACFMDSLTTLNFPAWGYGIRYDYGIFKQVIENFQQNELPDYWLTKGNPWEIMRLDIKYTIKFGGSVKNEYIHGKLVHIWHATEEVVAIAYDTVIPGWNTLMTNTLRLWKSFPSQEFDFCSFNRGDYQLALESKNNASYITSVLYPNDSTSMGKELRLKQQYFFCSATIQDIIFNFLQMNKPWSEFPQLNCIQMNDTHPAIAIPELLYQLVDNYSLEFSEAFDIVYRTFSYTNHTVLPEALEIWSVDILGGMLPRHLELIYLINHIFLEKVTKLCPYPKNEKIISNLSVIGESNPKLVRMANLCMISSHTVNGVAQIHTDLLKSSLFKVFNDLFPNKIINITNGVTPRRWIHCAFRELSDLLTNYYGNNDWLSDLSLLENLPIYIKSINKREEFIEKFSQAKLQAKRRLKAWVKENCRIEIDENFMFDVQVKRIHEYKRQFMNCLYCIYRYLKLKKMSKEELDKVVKRVTFFGGKASPGYIVAKHFIHLINMVSFVINNDPQTNNFFKVVFIPDYKVSLAQLIIPAADLSQHISLAGTEASGTSNMKFVMTGSLIIGTRDGANIEIAQEIGGENIFFFGTDLKDVEKVRDSMKNNYYVTEELMKVFSYILAGNFGEINFINEYINKIINGGDYYLVCKDFTSYIEAHKSVDRVYSNINEWYTRALVSISRMGFFSSDRSVQDYSDLIWKLKPIEVPKPSISLSKRVVSNAYLKKEAVDCKKSKSYFTLNKGIDKYTNMHSP